jgi:hypothetical protein
MDAVRLQNIVENWNGKPPGFIRGLVTNWEGD